MKTLKVIRITIILCGSFLTIFALKYQTNLLAVVYSVWTIALLQAYNINQKKEGCK